MVSYYFKLGGDFLSLTFQATKFIYNGISSDKFNLMICSFERSSGVSNSKEVSEITINSEKVTGSDKWLKINSDYSSPLSFTFNICKKGGTIFTAIERRMISAWLTSSHGEYKVLQFCSLEYSDVIFHAKCTTLEKNTIAGDVVGYQLTFTTNAPYGFTPEKQLNINMNSDVFTTNIMNSSDELETMLYPKLEITILQNCNFTIINNRINKTFGIDNCTVGEVITINPEIGYIYSSVRGTSVISAFNKVWFGLYCDTFNMSNNITINGKANVKIICSYPRKVGV